MSNGRDTASIRIESMLKEMSGSASYNPKIYKVDDELRQVNERAYDPVLVSIGPIHNNKDHLKPMEKIKVTYLHQLLQRKNETVDKYMEKLRDLEVKARGCYSNLIQLPEGDKFVEMLLLDGFFVIELLRKLRFNILRGEKEYIFHSSKVQHRVMLDLLLVENQLPLFVLDCLFDMTKSTLVDDSLSFLIRKLYWFLPLKDVELKMNGANVGDHLLGMLHRSYFSSIAAEPGNNENRPTYEGISTAVELEEAGVQFEPFKGVDLLDVSFINGVMKLPKLIITDHTETILRNFIAYEQMQPDDNHRPVSDYSVLMTDLVKSSKDVEILRRAGMFVATTGDNETDHQMFRQLGIHVYYNLHNSFCHLEVFDSVNKHCKKRRNKWMAMLRKNYFYSPWAILSVIAAFVLLFLTAMQTVYSALSYYEN